MGNHPPRWTDRLLKFGGTLSLIGLLISCLLIVASFWLNPFEHHLSLSGQFHVGVGSYGRRFHPRFVFFNDDEYGPYRGSLIGISDGQGGMISDVIDSESFGDTAGIYYRWFLWPEGPLWTLMISLWYPAGWFLLLTTACWMRHQSSRHAFTTKFTIRPGTAMTLTTVLPVM